MLKIIPIKKSDIKLQELMKIHYSQPKSFVGRQLFYSVFYDDIFYGCIAFGSATLHLPNRQIIGSINNGLNNIFYHIHTLQIHQRTCDKSFPFSSPLAELPIYRPTRLTKTPQLIGRLIVNTTWKAALLPTMK